MGDRWDALADDLVRGAQESFVADLTRLTEDMLRQGVRNPDMFAVLARDARQAALGVWARWSGKVSRQSENAFREALQEQDEELLAGIERAGVPPLHPDDGNWARNRIGEAARGMAEIMRRQNVAFADTQADLWYDVTAQAVTRTLGGEPRDSVMQRAVCRLAAKGLETVDYRSGVRTSIDAAVRRHVVTQSNQCRNDLLDRRCGQYGIDLVMVSAHYGARPSHAVWQGGVYSRSGAKGKYRGLAEATGYGTVGGLCGANCVVGDTLVGGPAPKACYRREYSGQLVTVRTALGHELTVTPNHPIMTPGGWVAAHKLVKGSYVLSSGVADGALAFSGPHEDECPPSIEEVFDALRDAFGVHTLLGSPGDFHGDGIADSNVDVVLVGGALEGHREAHGGEPAPEGFLGGAAGLCDSGLGRGPLAEVGVGLFGPAYGVVGGLGVSGALFCRHPGVSSPAGVGTILGGYPCLPEPVNHAHLGDPELLGEGSFGSSGPVEPDRFVHVEVGPAPVRIESQLDKPVCHGMGAALEHFGHGSDGLSCVVQVDQVVDVNIHTGVCHVYNLETEDGWYFANGIVTHNCRHTMTPYIEGVSKPQGTDFAAQQRVTGLTSDQYYEAVQQQRAAERRIRDTKRQIAALAMDNLDTAALRVTLGKQQAELRRLVDDNHLTRDYSREKAYGVQAARAGSRGTAGWHPSGERGISSKRGKNAPAKVDLQLVKSKAYKGKFAGLTGNPDADKALWKACVSCLTHRNGTDGEDLYLVSAVDGAVKATNTSSGSLTGIPVNRSMADAFRENDRYTLFSVHNHPSNVPPTGSDLSAAGYRGYAGGVVALHDGDVYYYSCRRATPFSGSSFDTFVESYRKKGYSTKEAFEKALDDYADRFGIEWRKL